MATPLTDKLARALEAPAKGNKVTYDTKVRGFGLRVTAKGAKSFVLNYRVNGRERRYTIGAYPDWSVAAAREEARALKREVNLGADPMGKRHQNRGAPSVHQLAMRYLEEHAISKAVRAQADDRSMIEKLVLPAIGNLKVQEVRHEDIDELHREISRTRPIRANRMAQLLGKMFSLAIRWEYRSDNPVRGLRKNPEHRRHRYLSNDELERLTAVLDSHPNRSAVNIVKLLMLTGARRGEILGAKWDQFDLDSGIWAKPSAHTKQRKEHRVPLSSAAIDLLKDLRSQSVGSAYLFPGASPDKPVTDIKNSWKGVCEKAGLVDCRVHDLRHTYASILASAGQSLPVIGALLGHTQPATTARYSHLFDDALRAATEQVGQAMTTPATNKARGKSHNLN